MRIEPFMVRTDRADVEAFARATGFQGIVETVPFAYPFRWLTGPVPRAVITTILGSATTILPVHESQVFERIADWRMDEDYVLRLELRRDYEPARLILRALLTTAQGDPCARLETVLRLISRQDLPD